MEENYRIANNFINKMNEYLEFYVSKGMKIQTKK